MKPSRIWTTRRTLACLTIVGAIGVTGWIADTQVHSAASFDTFAARIPPNWMSEAALRPAETNDRPEQPSAVKLAFSPASLAYPESSPLVLPDQLSIAQLWELVSAPVTDFARQSAQPAPSQDASAALTLRPAQRPGAILSDTQIASIKDRLKLTADQERYWPPVESALRALSWQTRHRGTHAPTLDMDSVQRLNAAASVLATKLSEDQKHEVRALTSIVGIKS